MKTTKLETVASMRAAAGRLNVSVDEVRAAKDAGCEAFDAGGRVRIQPLRRWLAKHRKAAKSKSKSTAPEPAPGVGGLSANLNRLAAEEQRLAALLKAAIGSASEVPARKAWLLCSEQLRRCDSSLAETRRDSGEFIPRAEIEEVLRVVGWIISTSSRDAVWQIAHAVEMNPDRRDVAAKSLHPVKVWLRNVSALGLAHSPKALPSWCAEAFGTGVEAGLATKPGDFVRMTEALRVTLDLAATEAFAELTNGTASPERK